MWIMTVGGFGSCKQAVIEHMVSKSYELIKDAPTTGASVFEQQLSYMVNRHNTAIVCRQRTKRDKVISSLGFWDVQLVFTPFWESIGLLSTDEVRILEKTYNALYETTPAPDFVLYLKNTVIGSSNRVKMKHNKTIVNEHIIAVSKLYDEYVEKIRVPVAEIDVNKDMQSVAEDLEVNVPRAKYSDGLFPRRFL